MKKYFFWIKSGFIELLVVFYSIFFVFFKKIKLSWKRDQYKKFAPILLIQGYLHNSFVWIYHGKKLIDKGFGPIYTINFNNPLASIEEQAFILKEKIDDIHKENKNSPITLIGHSMGGLIASYCALNFLNKNQIRDIISISTPYDGSFFAKIGVGKCAKEMKNHSTFVNNLKKQIVDEKTINFYFIASKTDQLVRPKSALMGQNLDKEYVFDDIGHATMLFSKKVNNKIAKWLEN